MTPGRAWWLPLLMAGLPLVAQAQVWGRVDERGVAHFAAEKRDESYELYFRGNAEVGPAGVSHGPDSVSRSSPSSSGWETPFLMGMAPPDTGAVVAPPSLLAFFQVSPAYKAVRHLIREAAQAHGVDAELLQAVIAAESGFDPLVVSPRGAIGLMQILPTTALAHGLSPSARHSVEVLLTDPRTNIHTGARILARLMVRFSGQLDVALAAYNAGEGAVRRAGRQVPNYPETRKYVHTVTQIYQHLLPPRAVQVRAHTARTLAAKGVLLAAGPASADAMASRPPVFP